MLLLERVFPFAIPSATSRQIARSSDGIVQIIGEEYKTTEESTFCSQKVAAKKVLIFFLFLYKNVVGTH